jgi:hypothetical protein
MICSKILTPISQGVPTKAIVNRGFGLQNACRTAGTPGRPGFHPQIVSERLGHASIGITLDTCCHVMPGMQEEAAEKIDAGLPKALAG